MATKNEAAALASALGGHRCGAGFMARCPAHADRTPSLAIDQAGTGRILVHCHAGCSQDRVIEALRRLGLWSLRAPVTGTRPLPCTSFPAGPKRPAAPLAVRLAHMWQASAPAAGSLVETYLRSRGIDFGIPAGLRFHAALGHPGGTCWPAMLARLSDRHGIPIPALHRTYLAHDGKAKAPVEPSRMMLGSCRGASVHLAPAASPLLVGEGIETCLAAMQATGHSAWAALSTSGLRSLLLPPDIRDVVVLADGDDAGEAAACACARRWIDEGRRVRIARPPRGTDFNDLLLGRTGPSEGR